jgi:hypothetical protein
MTKTRRTALIVLTATVIGAGFAYRSYRAKLGPSVDEVFNFAHPSDDLNLPIVTRSIKPSSSSLTFDVTHRHPGFYELIVAGPRDPGIAGHLDQAVINFTLSEGETTLFHYQGPPRSYFSKRDSVGTIFAMYRVPTDVPADRPITCTVSVDFKNQIIGDGLILQITKSGY